ncbi:MAG: bifunctional precorrin-2 dehydrogenase/sirohydrochlorin ferrochelatase [Nitrosomonadales bacterium]
MNLKNKTCLVVGGGDVAVRKAALLLQAGAILRVVAPHLNEAFKLPLGSEHIVESFQPVHLDGITLAIAATDDPTVNELVSQEAKRRNIPVNVVDNPALCTFIMPSILDRSPLLVAFSTGGASPVLPASCAANWKH